MTHEEILQAIAKIIGFAGTDYSDLPKSVEDYAASEYENGRSEGYDDGYSDAENDNV